MRLQLFGSALFALVATANVFSQSAAASPSPPAQLTSEQDHQHIMDMLHITSLRRGADGDPIAANAANYGVTKANPNPILPDPLLLKNGKKVTSAQMWLDER